MFPVRCFLRAEISANLTSPLRICWLNDTYRKPFDAQGRHLSEFVPVMVPFERAKPPSSFQGGRMISEICLDLHRGIGASGFFKKNLKNKRKT